jgi:hypothetical protein
MIFLTRTKFLLFNVCFTCSPPSTNFKSLPQRWYKICNVTLLSKADQNPSKIMSVTAQRISSTACSKNSPFPITLPSYFPTLPPICLNQKDERDTSCKICTVTLPSKADQNPSKIMSVTAQRISSTAYSKNSPFRITLPSYFLTLLPICLNQKDERDTSCKISKP